MWLDLIVEYLAGFAFGLFVFQSLFMKSVMGGSYRQNVRKTFLPEFISMNFMMAGMAPVMSLLMMGRDMRAMQPSELLFWGVMSFGVIAGFLVAYPANVWMVVQRLKHGLMTERKPRASKAHRDHAAHAGGKGEGGGHAGHAMKSDVTGPQLAAVAGVSFLSVVIGMVAPANWVNLRLSAREVGGAIRYRPVT